MMLEKYLYPFVFMIGLLMGSFYNVVGLRIPIKQSIVKPRSSCPACGQVLNAHELIPLLSYILQVGKCRHCKSTISPTYPLIELLTGTLFVITPLLMGWSFDTFIAWTLISLIIIIFVSDITYMLIPDKILLFFLFLFILIRIVSPLSPWWDSILGGLIGFGIPLFVALASNGGMGGGDIKLLGLIGILLGSQNVMLSLLFATLFGALFGFASLLLGSKEKRKPIPFGPFVGLGTLVTYFFGDQIVHWYVHLLF